MLSEVEKHKSEFSIILIMRATRFVTDVSAFSTASTYRKIPDHGSHFQRDSPD